MTDEAAPVHPQTRRNLIASMQAEALAHATYVLYAAHARQAGDEQLAQLFEQAAHDELHDHFAKQAELIGLVGTVVDNLRAAIDSERHEVQTIYREYAAKAAAAGDGVAAALFTAMRQDERRHEKAFREALAAAATPAALVRR